MTLLAYILIIIVLLLCSAFFSGSETALTAASKAKLHHLENDGDEKAKIVNRLLLKKEKLIGAILLGNNMVNIMASAIATSLFINYFGEAGVAYATIAMTLLILIFSEVLPKSYALYHSTQTALNVGPFIEPIVKILAPIIKAIQGIVIVTLKIFRIKLRPMLTEGGNEEEIRAAIDLHKGKNPEIAQERVMLKSVLDLGDVNVEDIMRHRKEVVMLDANETSSKTLKTILDSPYTRLPIWKDKPENIIGIIHVKDVLRAIRPLIKTGLKNINIDFVKLSSPPWFIPETTSLLDQLQAFRKRHEHFSVVVDEYGSFMGIVTLEDILEEIVGEISDEHDIALPPGIRPEKTGSYIIDGIVTIRDLNRQFEWKLPDEDAATLAGLILHEARRIPEIGQTFEYYNFRFEVLKRQRNQITLIRVTPQENSEENDIKEE